MPPMSLNEPLVVWASERANALLSPLGSRRLHVQGEVKRVYKVGETFEQGDSTLNTEQTRLLR